MTDFRPLTHLELPPKVQPRKWITCTWKCLTLGRRTGEAISDGLSGRDRLLSNVWLVSGRTDKPTDRYLRVGHENYDFYLVFGWVPAELGPETRSNGWGSKNDAERTQNQPRRPILRPFRDHLLVQTHN